MWDSSGIWCDVCEKPIFFDKFTEFKLKGFKINNERKLHACEKCVLKLKEMSKTNNPDCLPEGKLKEALQKVCSSCEQLTKYEK